MCRRVTVSVHDSQELEQVFERADMVGPSASTRENERHQLGLEYLTKVVGRDGILILIDLRPQKLGLFSEMRILLL